MKQAALPSTIPTKTVLAAASIHFHDICLELDVVSLPCQVEAVLWVGSGEKQAAVVLLPPLPSPFSCQTTSSRTISWSMVRQTKNQMIVMIL